HIARQLGIRQSALPPVLVPEHQRRTIVSKPEQVFGEIQARADEPARTELGVRRCHAIASHEDVLPGSATRPFVGDDTAEPPDRRPEVLRPLDGPSIQRREVPTPGRRVSEEPRDVRAGDPLRGRSPERSDGRGGRQLVVEGFVTLRISTSKMSVDWRGILMLPSRLRTDRPSYPSFDGITIFRL